MTAPTKCPMCHVAMRRSAALAHHFILTCPECGYQVEQLAGPITRDEALAALLSLADGDDAEEGHRTADMILLRMIDDPQIIEAFLALTRWYA